MTSASSSPGTGWKEARETIRRTGIRLQEEGLVAGTWGNLSLKVDEGHFVISPSGLCYNHTKSEHVAIVNIRDLRWEGDAKPSSEKGLHAALYQVFPDIGAIVHTHQSAASAVAAAHMSIGDNIPCAEYALPTTDKLADHAVRAMKRTVVSDNGWRRILLANHGAVCAARNLKDAVSAAMALEKEAEAFVEKTYFLRRHAMSDKMALAYEYARLAVKKGQTTTLRFRKKFSQSDVEWAPRFIQQVFERRKDVNYILFSRLPYTRAFAFTNRPLKPLLDDMAQIIGSFAGCIEDMRLGGEKEPGERNAVFIKSDGAFCFGRDESDARAVQSVLEKASRSHIESVVLGGGHVIPWLDRLIMRLMYKKKYSRLKYRDK
jgi:L-fuculose-phosphate aldolase